MFSAFNNQILNISLSEWSKQFIDTNLDFTDSDQVAEDIIQPDNHLHNYAVLAPFFVTKHFLQP